MGFLFGQKRRAAVGPEGPLVHRRIISTHRALMVQGGKADHQNLGKGGGVQDKEVCKCVG